MTEQTHVASTPNKKPIAAPTTLDVFKLELQKGYDRQINNYFKGDKEKAMKFMSAVTHSVQKIPGLLECDRLSLMNSFMACAEYELYPSNVSGEAYVLPYKNKAQFQLGVQGIITLLYRAGVESIQANVVFKDDHFEYEEGLEPKLVHKPDVFKTGGRGEAIGVYAIASVNGQKMFKVMSKDEIMKYKEFSQSKTSEYSPWNSNKDPQLFMWQKTCIKQLAKFLPKNDALQRAIAQDNEESTIPKSSFDAGGPAVAKAFHQPEPSEPSEREKEQILKDELAGK